MYYPTGDADDPYEWVLPYSLQILQLKTDFHLITFKSLLLPRLLLTLCRYFLLECNWFTRFCNVVLSYKKHFVYIFTFFWNVVVKMWIELKLILLRETGQRRLAFIVEGSNHRCWCQPTIDFKSSSSPHHLQPKRADSSSSTNSGRVKEKITNGEQYIHFFSYAFMFGNKASQ